VLNISRKLHQKKGKKGYKWEAATERLSLSTTRLKAGSGTCRLEVVKPSQVSPTGHPVFLAPKLQVYAKCCNS